MRRILYLSRGGSVGGAQRQLQYVVTNLDRERYEPIVVCDSDGEAVSRLQEAGIATSVFGLRPWRKFPAGLLRYFDAERVVRAARRLDVALVHSSDLWLNGYLTWIAPRLGVNVLRQDFSPDAQILVGIIGRISPLKRQLDFLRAADEIARDSATSAAFFVIGEVHSPRYFETLRQFVSQRHLDQRVFFTGRRTDVPQVLASLDILVSLSGGSVMFEAMACGKPVVSAGFSSRENSVHIQDGRTGLLVTSRRTSDLVEAILRLIDAPDLRSKIGRQARIWAEDRLSHLSMVARTQRLYEHLLQD